MLALVFTTFVLDIAGGSAHDRGLVGAWIRWTTTTFWAIYQSVNLIVTVQVGITHPPSLAYITPEELALSAEISIICQFLCARRYRDLFREWRGKRKEQTK